MTGTDRDRLVVATGTITDTSPGGLGIVLSGDLGLDLAFVADVVVTRSIGSIRHLLVRALAFEGGALRAAFVDPPTVEPAEWGESSAAAGGR